MNSQSNLLACQRSSGRLALFSNFLRKYRHEWSEEEINNIKNYYYIHARRFEVILVSHLQWSFMSLALVRNTNPSKWIITHNKESIDIGRAFARTIVWDKIKMLKYDNPILSFIIDLTQPQKNFLHAISSPIFEEIICIPEHYLKKPSKTFEELFNKFYSDNKRWRYDDFWFIIDPLLKLISNPSKGRSFWQWEGAGSLASEFRKEANSRKPDFWVLIEVDNTIQEMLYEENSDDYESLYEKLCMIELFLIQAYRTNLRICIMDQPAPLLCRVRELFNIPIPYKLPVGRISVLYFVHNLWKIHLGFIETVEKMGNINQIINRSRQGPTIQHVYDLPTLAIQDFTSFPTP
ncbi:9322_t:CDS:2 [Cetraspora pellucida]|uniref:9322_t:CDS:1 n=1 Tax=Cetraspora pellucida TaxID=1433469 RepID=A0ACA9MRY8_9GLOM|nr:9322_t:CDS:2 [Cetraspora pellucida]